MASHALRGMCVAWLGLIALQVAGTQGGSGRLAGLATDIDRLMKRALDPGVPAIPDRRTATTPTVGAGTPWVSTPGTVVAGTHPTAHTDPSTGAATGFGG